jgi:hypothetical protein
MSDQQVQTPRLVVACLEFINQETQEEGSFQIAVEAVDAIEAARKCRARLEEIANSSDNLGPIIVYMEGLVELGREGLTKGTLFNFVKISNATPASPGAPPGERSASPEPAEGVRAEAPVFWSGVEDFRTKWKLYWCETDDHDEDWFVIAHDEEEAMRFHEDAEGYDEDDATAKLVCVLPASEQARYSDPSWPSEETLLACGAEYLPFTTQDGADELRVHVGSGSRAVRLKGSIYSEGDIVGNTLQRMGGREAS